MTRENIVLGGFDDGEQDLWATCDHGVYDFANQFVVMDSHLIFKSMCTLVL